MSMPTFDDAILVSRAGRDAPGPPRVRARMEDMPGVNGRYVQPLGTAGRAITASGVLVAAGATPAEAHQALKSLLRGKQSLADGVTVGVYVGTDGVAYQHCMLTSYEATGPFHVSPSESDYQALVSVEARVEQLAP